MANQNNPQFPPLLELPPVPPNRELSYYFFYSANLPNTTLPTLIIYSASDNPCLPQFFDGLLHVLYVPTTHAFISYTRFPPPPYPRVIIPQNLHFLPPFGPIHLMGENPPLLPSFLHFRHQFEEQRPPPPLPPRNNPGYPQNLIPGNRAYFVFRMTGAIDGVVISSTTDNPWNNPLVFGFLDFEYLPDTRALVPRLRPERPAYPRYCIPTYLENLPRGPIELINAPLPNQGVVHSPPPPPPPSPPQEEEPARTPVKRRRGEASSSGGSKKHQVQNGQRNYISWSTSSESNSSGSKKKTYG